MLHTVAISLVQTSHPFSQATFSHIPWVFSKAYCHLMGKWSYFSKDPDSVANVHYLMQSVDGILPIHPIFFHAAILHRKPFLVSLPP